jgi:hypothetical protein
MHNSLALNMCWRAFKSGSGIYIRLSKRRLIACKYKLISQNNLLLTLYGGDKSRIIFFSPGLKHKVYLLLQEQELSGHCFLHPTM